MKRPPMRPEVRRKHVAEPNARSRLTNGYTLPGVDNRSTWVRRLRDLMGLQSRSMSASGSCDMPAPGRHFKPPWTPQLLTLTTF